MQPRYKLSTMHAGIILGVALAFAITWPASANSFVVNSTDDTDDGICDVSHCSLREAINAANDNPGPDTISFAGLTDSGNQAMIRLTTPLPPLLDDGTTIDGTTVQGYSGSPGVVITKDVPVIEEGLHLQSNNNVIDSLSIAGFGGWPGHPDPMPSEVTGGAIVVTGSGNLIQRNEIGWGALPNGIGVRLVGGGNSVIANVIGNSTAGIDILGPAQVVQGNKIGTDASGTTANGNAYGIYDAASSGGGHLIGGNDISDGNLISGNSGIGVLIGSNSNAIHNNLIGTDVTGSYALGNGSNGLRILSHNNVIGGPGTGNLISGNSDHGLCLSTGSNNGNIIQGNNVGTDISGASPIPNGGHGIYHVDGAGALVGGLSPGEGNILAFNFYDGIEAEGSGHTIIGNLIHDNSYYGVNINGNTVISQNSIFENANFGIYDQPAGATDIPSLNPMSGVALTGSACPQCLVEIFIADPDPSGSGEGKEFLGSALADSNGYFSTEVNAELPLCGQLTATATDTRPHTSMFSQNLEVNCYRIGPIFLIPIWSFIIIVFGIFGVLIRRLSAASPTWIIPGSLGLGAIAGAGLIILGSSLPNVRIGQAPEPAIPFAGDLPSCDLYLKPEGFTPEDGSVLLPNPSTSLSWEPTGNMPAGAIRWIVELHEVNVDVGIHTTADSMVMMADMGLDPNPGSQYEWSLIGEQQLANNEVWLPFCAPSTSMRFDIAPEEPVPETAPIEEAADCEPSLTALMNLTCRSGPLKEYEELGYLLEGETAVPEGQNEDGTWYWIQNPDWQGHCWVWSGGVEAACMPEKLSLISYDPLPMEPPEGPQCTRDLGRNECNSASGIYRAGDEPFCECP